MHWLTVRGCLKTLSIFLFLLTGLNFSAPAQHTLWYGQPAEEWVEELPGPGTQAGAWAPDDY